MASQPTLCSTARWESCSFCPFRTQTFHKSQPLSGSSIVQVRERLQQPKTTRAFFELPEGAWMAAAASLDRIPSLSAQKILTRHWSQAETSGIVEGHCLNCCYKVMCDVLAVLSTFTLICESNANAVVHPLWPSNSPKLSRVRSLPVAWKRVNIQIFFLVVGSWIICIPHNFLIRPFVQQLIFNSLK